jgi:hypothetical protein
MNTGDSNQDMSNPSDNQGTEKKKADLFYHGTITKLFPRNSLGIVRTESGREVAFSYQLVILLGEIKSPHDLREGQEIGYDFGWTSNGLRVTKIRTYTDPSADQGGSG